MKAADGPLASSYKPSTDQKSPSNVILCSVVPLQFYRLIHDPGSRGDLFISGFFFCIFYTAAASWWLVVAASYWTPPQELVVDRQHLGIQMMDWIKGGGESGLRGATGGVSTAWLN